jgi:hypothetical protein
LWQNLSMAIDVITVIKQVIWRCELSIWPIFQKLWCRHGCQWNLSLSGAFVFHKHILLRNKIDLMPLTFFHLWQLLTVFQNSFYIKSATKLSLLYCNFSKIAVSLKACFMSYIGKCAKLSSHICSLWMVADYYCRLCLEFVTIV